MSDSMILAVYFTLLIMLYLICFHVFFSHISKIFDGSIQDNTIDFMEYVAAVHLVLRGKLEDKLKWSFKVYDRDGNGRLDKSEVKHIVKVRNFTITVSCPKVTV